MLKLFCDWLAATPISQLFQSVAWFVPVMQSIHILAVSFVMASMAMLNLRLLGITGRAQTVSTLVNRFLSGLVPAIIILASTGAVLTIAEPARELFSTAFRLKMILLACAIGVTLVLRSSLRSDLGFWERLPPPAKARLTGVVALCLWIAIAGCGRWIAYAQD